ncbi:transmembrane protein 109 [Carcharodon carcharias]|uniref:transmembrane protein 109 n=1 Tax=Carcharodon carcharias TaxID=13397 RepID=UPI001B7DE3B1|nr:transmembrane protein 109 [Carcharodon carcharias]
MLRWLMPLGIWVPDVAIGGKQMATLGFRRLLLLLLLLLRGGGAAKEGERRTNIFRSAATAVEELLPGGAGETLLSYWKVVMNGTSAIASLLTELCSDLLDTLGIKDGELGTDREALGRALSWALAALLIYLALSAALHLLTYLAGRLLWLAKLGLFFTAAAYVVATCEDEKRRNALLLGLGALYLLLGRLGLPFLGGWAKADRRQHHLENKISSLEQQLAEVERRVHHRNLYDYD